MNGGADTAALVELGLWVSLPFVGGAVLRPLVPSGLRRRLRTRPVAALGLATAAGVFAWSLPLLLLAEAGRFSTLGKGSAGWLLCALGAAGLAVHVLRRPRAALAGGWRARVVDLVLVALVCGAGALAFAFPSNTLIGNRDEGVYSNTGAFLARTGGLDVPYPWRTPDEFVAGHLAPPGFTPSETFLRPLYSHLYPSWLAAAAAVGGLEALLRLNGLFVLLSGLCFYLLVRTVAPEPVALGAAAILLLGPAQVWISRVTLSEALAQLGIVLTVLLASWAIACDRRGLARAAGFCAGLAGAVRLDGLLVLPFLFGGAFLDAHLLRGRHAAVWRAVLQTAVPTWLGVLVSYEVFSPDYFGDLRERVAPMVLGTLIAASSLVLIDPSRPLFRKGPWRERAALAAAVVVVAWAAWSWWVRPHLGPEYDAEAVAAAVADGRPPPDVADERIRSLRNLARYLTPGLVAFAVFGAARAGRRLVAGRAAVLLPAAVVFGGYSVLYLADPMVFPGHFWAVRRFVPAVLPGFVFFAALGVHGLPARGVRGRARWGRFPPALRSVLHSVLGSARRYPAVVVAAAVLAVLAALGASGGDFYRFQENPRVVEQLRRVAGRLPQDRIVLLPIRTEQWQTWVTPLRVAFGHRIVPLNPASRDGRRGLSEFWQRQHRRGEPVWILLEEGADPGDWPDEWPPARRVAGLRFDREMFESTRRPLPEDVVRTVFRVGLYRSDPPLAARIPRGRPRGVRSVLDRPGGT